MRRNLFGKLKQNKAFTLMEMMITVTLIVVLLGVSVLAISDWAKKMKMTELDNHAKSIYLEAQNQLATMEAEGSLPKLYNDFAQTGGAYHETYKDRKLTETPADYNMAAYGDFYEGIYYFSNDDSVVSLFVPTISVSDEKGNYLIEVSPETGDVYGVFYWETSNTYITENNAPAIYAKLKSMEAKGGTNNRSLDSRTDYQVGYYGGHGGDTISTSAYKLNQLVRIINGEELYIEISYDLNDRIIEHLAESSELFDIEVTIKGETSGAVWIPDFELKDNFVEDAENGRIITGFLLDGMGAGQSFKEITDNAAAKTGEEKEMQNDKTFLPGENLEISVKTIYQQGGIKLKEQSSVYRTNTLFHDVTDRLVDDGHEQIIERTIGVSAVRHLRNLGEYYYSGDVAMKANDEDVDSYVIVQKNDIDFNKGTYWFSEGRPIASLAPIENKALFWAGGKDVEVNGNNFVIRNLIVASNVEWDDVDDNTNGETAVGLFKRTKDVHFVNVKLEDYTVKAPTNSTYTGGLVGLAIGGKIEQSGVYLAPSYRDENGVKQYYNQDRDNDYGTVMQRHYATMTISGGNVVGGLVGRADQTIIKDSFAAIQVKGVNTVGGLIGSAYGKMPADHTAEGFIPSTNISGYVTIENSYASGDVTATGKEAGGFIAYAGQLCVNNAYATGDVYCNDELGGFLAETEYSYYRHCHSYGEVLNLSGNDTFVSGTEVGGFFAIQRVSNADTTNVGYLGQVGYNSNDTAFVDDELFKREYKDLQNSGENNSAASSHPYDGNLLFKAFPFEMVTDNHYGDWPIQYFINTSLVYYEKYADGTYGYYSVTKLTDASESNADANKYVWVLDSLRSDKEIREDGYALLTMFYLESVDYTVYQYKGSSPSWQIAKNQDGTQIKGTLSIVENPLDAGSDKMVNLTQQGTLVFNAYEEESDRPYSVNYKEKDIKSSFTTNGMYLYQLPYDLQNTYRYDVKDFYDVIVFDEGYAKGNTKGENGEVGGTPVISDEQYYYCPHFPKLAVNPGMDKGTGVQSNGNFKHLGQPTQVAVRTARHLNNLGRVPYYWNNRGGATDVITYNQELDINFSTYAYSADTRFNKMYCGEVYNLLAFGTDYENEPIGQNAQLSTGYGAFQNDYNGNYHKIIDYCVKSSNQYVGLFGEIYKAGGATGSQISNVVMMVSEQNKGNQGNYGTVGEREQNNAGLIISNYQEQSNASGDDRQRTGIGALVGSDYTVGLTDGEAKVFTIYNCASAGYQVQYHIEPLRSGCQQPLGIALGGMIGYSRGNVAQSTATNDVKLVAKASLEGNNAAVMIGGFTGSAFFGTTLNCYSGGSISVDDSNGTCYVNRLRIGGFCPGWMYAEGVENESNDEDVRYQNIYSYTTVSDDVWTVRESSDGNYFNHLIPTVSRMRLYYKSVMTGFLKWEYKWDTESENGSNAVRVPGFSYYLTTVFNDSVMDRISGEAEDYFMKDGNDSPKTCDPATYDNLSKKSWVNSNTDFGNTVKFISTAEYSELVYDGYAVPISSELADEEYTFPLFVFDADGQYVHYGDWPLKP